MQDCTFVKGKYCDAMTLSLLQEKPIHWTGQRELPQCVFDRKLPDRHHTKQHLVGWVDKHRFRGGR